MDQLTGASEACPTTCTHPTSNVTGSETTPTTGLASSTTGLGTTGLGTSTLGSTGLYGNSSLGGMGSSMYGGGLGGMNSMYGGMGGMGYGGGMGGMYGGMGGMYGGGMYGQNNMAGMEWLNRLSMSVMQFCQVAQMVECNANSLIQFSLLIKRAYNYLITQGKEFIVWAYTSTCDKLAQIKGVLTDYLVKPSDQLTKDELETQI